MSGPDEVIDVPLTLYIDGERHVIGSARIRGSEIHAVLDDQRSNEVLDWLFRQDEGEFSLRFGGSDAAVIRVPPRIYPPGSYTSLKGIVPKGVYLDEAATLFDVPDGSGDTQAQ